MTKKENVWVSLLFSVVIPAIILMGLSSEKYLGAMTAFLFALVWPVGYGAWGVLIRRDVSFIAVIGLLGVLLTGGIGLFRLDVKWLALKEAFVPFIIGLVVLLTARTKWSVTEKMLNQILDKQKIEQELLNNKKRGRYKVRLQLAVYLITASFWLSAVLNYVLAKLIVTSATGSEAFNEELGRMTLISYPVIVVPSLLVLITAVVILLNGLEKDTGIEVEKLLRKDSRKNNL